MNLSFRPDGQALPSRAQRDLPDLRSAVGVPVAGGFDAEGQALRAGLKNEGVAGRRFIAGVVDADEIGPGAGGLEGPDSVVAFAGPVAEVPVLLFEREVGAEDFTIDRKKLEDAAAGRKDQLGMVAFYIFALRR